MAPCTTEQAYHTELSEIHILNENENLKDKTFSGVPGIHARLESVLWIRIHMNPDPELLPGSGIIVPDPDLAKSERAFK